MEPPAVLPDSPMEQDDIPFPCKGCGEILEEGKAFELAGNRWHIDCFRCNTCGTMLDSDAHLLLLGDGSLICNNCTYSCSSCGNKIEDLAILTGDQAFCANCFKCRNCKRRIENLRYARTSQGIFCMDCHESLMQRRRKKKIAAAAANKKASVKLDKSLPSLPMELQDAEQFTNDAEPPAIKYPDESPDISSRSRSADRPVATDRRHVESPARPVETPDNLILPSSTYRNNRHSVISTKSDADNVEEFLIPVAFDPTPEEHPSSVQAPTSSGAAVRDYFAPSKPSGPSQAEPAPQSQPPPERQEVQPMIAPHIAFQAQPRQNSETDSRRRQEASKGSQLRPDAPDTSFRLQDAPKGRRSESVTSSRSDLPASKDSAPASSVTSPVVSPSSTYSADRSGSTKPDPKTASRAEGAAAADQKITPRAASEAALTQEQIASDAGQAGPSAPTMQYPPKRGDSLANHGVNKATKTEHAITRKAVSNQVDNTSSDSSTATANKEAGGSGAKPTSDAAAEASKESGDDTRSRPSLELRNTHSRTDSLSTLRSEPPRAGDLGSSPSLLRYSGAGDFSLDEDITRILSGQPTQPSTGGSLLKRVSNSVRHGRSASDKTTRLSRDAKWQPRSPTNGTFHGQDISSPVMSSPEARDEINYLKNELRRERQRLIERDQKIAELESSINSVAEVKQANTELREKRSTMVVLDARKEIALRELTILTDHLKAEKDSSVPMDLAKISNSAIRNLAEALQKLKESFAPQIEELMQKKVDLVEEVAKLSRMKDKSFQEFEQLSSKNAQLAELNNQLVHQIQELYKANSAPSSENARATNGLGIYSHSKEKSTGSVELLKTHDLTTSMSTMSMQPEEADAATVVPGPQVVSIRKGQPRKFNWKRGGQNITKGVTKGLKGAFSSESREGMTDTSSAFPRSQTQDPSRQGFGFFSNPKKQAVWKGQQNGTSPSLGDGASTVSSNATLFGLELEQRLEQEKSNIPFIVARCIQEVELRGMDAEGIYRKSGAASVIQTIKDGFEGPSGDFDISDPDIDIHAVTSTLKQYFRKLPTPLITQNVYDSVLETNEITPQSARVEAVRRSLQEMPRVHLDVLQFLVFHLKRVVDHEKENLMTSQNIAVVFAPTIMRPESVAREMTDVQKKTESVKFIVENSHGIFM